MTATHSFIPPLHARISLVLAGLALLAVACGGPEASDQLSAAEEAATVPQPTAAEPTSEPITEPASAPDPTAAPVPTAVPTPTAEPTPQPVAPPATFSERGPYAVGVTTRSLGDRDVEVWYPVDPELVDGQPTETFDALTAFPEPLRVIVPLELSGEYDTLAFRDAADRYGKAGLVLEDALGGRLTYRKLLIGARALGARLEKMSQPGEALGIMLPNANAVIVTFLALQSAGRVAAMLNYTAGSAALVSALSTAEIRTVLASRAFVDKAGLEAQVAAIEQAGVSIVWLEDLRQQISNLEKAAAFLNWRKPLRPVKTGDPAVILFTSGSEGTPKGVVLSHTNLHANAAQAESRIDISVRDKLFNVLPVFHSFGLTGGAILPLLYGVKLFLYPSPLHYRIIPAVAREVKPTIMFGTDTFLAGYARTAKDTDFESLRLIVAGAEAVREATRRIYHERFGAVIVEGFGMTEASPVAAVNSRSHSKDGTVGRLLPGMALRLEPVEGINDGGRLFVSGPNVMLGYMMSTAPGKLQPLAGNWHDSGDIVAVDEDGFIAIRGRAKRFAKIAGEMISLGAIELMVQKLWPEAFHAAVAVPDSRRGERIVLVTTKMPALREELRDYSRRLGGTELMVPGEIVNVAEIPVLGSGKTDYVTAQKIADEWIHAHRADNKTT